MTGQRAGTWDDSERMSDPLTLRSLPLFPLKTVLFPGGLLSLRVFEVRYLDMVRKCQRAGAPFGVVALQEGEEVRGAGAATESLASAGTLATIEALEAPQPGLLAIRCAGTQRFHITRQEQLKHGLWIADVEQMPADLHVPVPGDLKSKADALEQLVQALQLREPEEALPMRPPWHFDDCGWVANRWCEMLPIPVALKQRLMALDNPLVRLELVSDILERVGIAN
jgi:uncharacterized protein